jgi:arthrofactin-type cyclic lipopeptide synthetase C
MRGAKGSAPLFFVHDCAEERLFVSSLLPQLDPAVPVYGLPAQSRQEEPLRTVEGMANRLVQMIRAVQPVGPYRVAGLSFGGVLAYEIAVQLLGADEKVEFVGLVNAHYPCGIRSLPVRNIETTTDNELLLMVVETSVGSDIDPEEQATLAELKSISAEVDLATLARKCRERLLLPLVYSDLAVAELQQKLGCQRSYIIAGQRYSAGQISVVVHLFVPQRENASRPLLGWDAVVPKDRLRVLSVNGKREPVSLIPNVAALGKVVSDAVRNAPAGSAAVRLREYSPLICLQEGNRVRAPLFCVPGAGANVISFVDLLPPLGRTWPIYGLQPRGLSDGLVPHSGVAEASHCYLRAIHEICPRGPIHLLGHSFGGWIVFEMARRFIEGGRGIASLTIVDTEAPDDGETAIREYDSVDVIMAWIEALELMIERSLGIQRCDLDTCSEAARRIFLHACLLKHNLLPRRWVPEDLRGLLGTFGAALRTCYTPRKPYLGPVRMIVVDDPRLDADANRERQRQMQQGWEKWARNLVFSHASGNHLTVLKQPHVLSIARLIQRDEY